MERKRSRRLSFPYSLRRNVFQRDLVIFLSLVASQKQGLNESCGPEEKASKLTMQRLW